MRCCVYLYSQTKYVHVVYNYPYKSLVRCLCQTVISKCGSQLEVQPLFLYATSIEISISKKKILPMYSLVFHARISKHTVHCNEEGCYVDFFIASYSPF